MYQTRYTIYWRRRCRSCTRIVCETRIHTASNRRHRCLVSPRLPPFSKKCSLRRILLPKTLTRLSRQPSRGRTKHASALRILSIFRTDLHVAAVLVRHLRLLGSLGGIWSCWSWRCRRFSWTCFVPADVYIRGQKAEYVTHFTVRFPVELDGAAEFITSLFPQLLEIQIVAPFTQVILRLNEIQQAFDPTSESSIVLLEYLHMSRVALQQ